MRYRSLVSGVALVSLLVAGSDAVHATSDGSAHYQSGKAPRRSSRHGRLFRRAATGLLLTTFVTMAGVLLLPESTHRSVFDPSKRVAPPGSRGCYTEVVNRGGLAALEGTFGLPKDTLKEHFDAKREHRGVAVALSGLVFDYRRAAGTGDKAATESARQRLLDGMRAFNARRKAADLVAAPTAPLGTN